jgi:hypothetical protein
MQNNNNGLNGASTILNYTDYATNIVYKNPSSVVTNVVTDSFGNFNSSFRERSGTENLVRSGLATVGTNCAIYNSDLTCKECKDGYILDSKKTCMSKIIIYKHN